MDETFFSICCLLMVSKFPVEFNYDNLHNFNTRLGTCVSTELDWKPSDHSNPLISGARMHRTLELHEQTLQRGTLKILQRVMTGADFKIRLLRKGKGYQIQQ